MEGVNFVEMCRRGEVAKVAQVLADVGAEVNTRGMGDMTGLMAAALGGRALPFNSVFSVEILPNFVVRTKIYSLPRLDCT